MAKIYECDRCGHQERYTDGIVGNEFEHYGKRHRLTKYKSRRGFQTLAKPYRIDGMVDLCEECFEVVTTAKREGEDEKRKRGFERFKDAMLGRST